MILVAVREHGGVVFGAQVSLHAFAVCGAARVDVFACFVAADEGDGLDAGLVDDEVYGFGGPVNDVDDAWGEAGFGGELGEDHAGAGVALGGLDDDGVAGYGGDGDAPEGDHGGEVYT